MRIFLTAAASRGDQTQWVAARLRTAGHVVCSTWHRAHLAGLEAMAATSERHQQIAGSDALVALLEVPADDETEAQRDVGFAHARAIPVVELVGDRGPTAASSSFSELAASLGEVLLLAEVIANAKGEAAHG